MVPQSDFSPRKLVRQPLAMLRKREAVVMALLYGCTLFSLLITVAIIAVLVSEAAKFFSLPEVTVRDFLFGTKWNPLLGADRHFGIAPLLCGSVLVAFVAMLVSLPLGLVTAIYLSEFTAPALRSRLRFSLEILAGIPTVVYGFFALTFITPILMRLRIGFDFYSGMSAGIAVGILCVPAITASIESALHAVPNGLRASAFALGATKFEVVTRGDRAGRFARNCVSELAGVCSRDGRDDGSRFGGRKSAKNHARSTQRTGDNDGLYRSGGGRKSQQLWPGVLFDLRGRRVSVSHNVLADGLGLLSDAAVSGVVRMSGPTHTAPIFDRFTRVPRRGRGRRSALLMVVCIAAAVTSLAIVSTLLLTIGLQGLRVIRPAFFINPPSPRAAEAGIGPALAGTFWICVWCGIIAFPLGIGTGDSVARIPAAVSVGAPIAHVSATEHHKSGRGASDRVRIVGSDGLCHHVWVSWRFASAQI